MYALPAETIVVIKAALTIEGRTGIWRRSMAITLDSVRSGRPQAHDTAKCLLRGAAGVGIATVGQRRVIGRDKDLYDVSRRYKER